MINRNETLRDYGLISRARQLWQNRYVRIALQLAFLIGMGAVTALAKRASLPLGIPGHSAVTWLGAMVAGRAIVRKDGAGLVIGVSTAFWGMPIGIENGFMRNLWLYGLTGLGLDLFARLPFINIRNPFGAIICGTLAHMVKFGFILAAALTASTTTHFMIFGTLKAASLHLLFGAIAGIAGWFVYWCGSRIKDNMNRKEIKP